MRKGYVQIRIGEIHCLPPVFKAFVELYPNDARVAHSFQLNGSFTPEEKEELDRLIAKIIERVKRELREGTTES